MKITKDMMVLDVDEIRPNPNQPRKYFDDDKLRTLAESIKEVGVDTPLKLVWLGGKGDNGCKAEINDGERRWRAIKHYTNIKQLRYPKDFIYVDVPKADKEIRSLISNCMREDLKPVEKARALRKLLKRRGIVNNNVAISTINRAKDWLDNDFISEPTSRNYFVPEEIVKQVGTDMKTIGISGTNATELLKILDLPKKIQEKIIFSPPNTKIFRQLIKRNRFGHKMKPSRIEDEAEFIPLSFGYELARLKDKHMIYFLVQKAYKEHWNCKKLNMMITDFMSSGLSAEEYIKSYHVRCKNKSHNVGELSKMSIRMDNISSTISSFRIINLVAISDQFQQKNFIISAKGLRESCIRLRKNLDDILCNAIELAKIKESERKTVLKLPFRVKLTSTAKSRKPAFRFSIPIEIGQKIEEQIGHMEEGYEIELQVNAVIVPGIKNNPSV